MSIVSDDEQAVLDLSRERLQRANINPVTRLATDYLNHFNEVIMLIDMLDMMPECIEDVLLWEPKSYRRHFEESGFAEKDLAIAAYDHAPRVIRLAFDHTVAEIDTEIFSVQSMLREHGRVSPRLAAELASILAEELRPLMDRASGIVNGTLVEETVLPTVRAQDTVDALFG